MNKIIIFGAGRYGQMALQHYGVENVAYFVDNNSKLWGSRISGIEVKCTEAVEAGAKVVIASKSYLLMQEQLRGLGVNDFTIFKASSGGYYMTEQLIVNPYSEGKDISEDEQIERSLSSANWDTIDKEVDELYGKDILFNHVEIETVNRCNGMCEFCPVNKKNDTRDFIRMERSLFDSIIEQLAQINYSGKLALFSNNEPFLDDDIIDKHEFARKKLPHARMHLFTNGTLLTIDKFRKIMAYLDELIIDNYQQELKLIKPCLAIKEYCEAHPDLKQKVTIVLRKPKEVLSTRGGDAPNRSKKISYGERKCVLPFKQFIIRPDGKISLCCNDPLGKETLGDLTQDSMIDIWRNEKFKHVRECLQKGRKYYKHCEFCDVMNLG